MILLVAPETAPLTLPDAPDTAPLALLVAPATAPLTLPVALPTFSPWVIPTLSIL